MPSGGAQLRRSARLEAQRRAANPPTVRKPPTRRSGRLEAQGGEWKAPPSWVVPFRMCGWCRKSTARCCPECEDRYEEEVDTPDGPVVRDGRALCRPCRRKHEGLCIDCWHEKAATRVFCCSEASKEAYLYFSSLSSRSTELKLISLN